MQEGRGFSTVSYDYNKKAESTTTYTVLQVNEVGREYHASVKATVSSKNEKPFELNYLMRCDGANYYVDMATYLSQLRSADAAGMDVSVSGDFLAMPEKMVPGEVLRNGQVMLDMMMEGIPTMSLSYKIIHRKVLGKEVVSTKVGDFKCQKVVFDYESSMGLMNLYGTVIEWWTPDMLLVKTEQYNSNGKLTSTTLIETIY